MLELKLQYSGHLMQSWLIWKDPDAGKDWGQEEKGVTGWDGWMASLTRWREFEWILGVGEGQEGLACCDSWGHKELDTTKWLNWTERVQGFPGGSDGKESACNVGDLGSIPGSGRSPGEGKGNPLWYSCLENPMDRGAWWAIVHGVAKSQTRLSNFTSLCSKQTGWRCLMSVLPHWKQNCLEIEEWSLFPTRTSIIGN